MAMERRGKTILTLAQVRRVAAQGVDGVDANTNTTNDATASSVRALDEFIRRAVAERDWCVVYSVCENRAVCIQAAPGGSGACALQCTDIESALEQRQVAVGRSMCTNAARAVAYRSALEELRAAAPLLGTWV
jgi:hypothetical protein